MTILVVGLGSIGARHARLAQGLGHEVRAVTRRPETFDGISYPSLPEALAAGRYDLIVIANETAAHWPALGLLADAGFDGLVLVEKPLAIAPPPPAEARAIQAWAGDRVRLAYNLRLHPALQALKAKLEGRPLVSVAAYAGQDLRSWRPGQPVEQSYSSSAALGGGVLRDLSHELDYLAWIVGDWTRLTAIGGRMGGLPIDSDDCWGVLMATGRVGVLSLEINYHHQPGARTVIVNTGDETISVDLVRSSLTDASGETVWTVDRDFTYVAQLRALMDGGDAPLCTLNEGLATMTTIAAIETAAAEERWVSR